MMRWLITVWMALLLWGEDEAFRAYVTSREFNVTGALYGYDFNKNGRVEHDEYLYQKEKSLYHVDLHRGFDTSLNRIDFPLEKAVFKGYVAFDSAKEVYILLDAAGRVSRFKDEGIFEPVGEELGYEIDDGWATAVYKDLSSFKNIEAFYDTPGFAWSLAPDGDALLVADGKMGVEVLDKQLSQLLWHYVAEAAVFDVAPLGGALYALGTDNGLCIVNKKKSVVAKRLFEGSYVSKLANYQQGILALVDHKGVFLVIENGQTAQMLDHTVEEPQDFCHSGDKVFVADAKEGVVLIADRKEKVLDRTDITSLAVVNDRYLVAVPFQSSRLLVYDLKKKRSWEYAAPAEIERVKVQGGALYLLYKEAFMDRLRVRGFKKLEFLERIYLPYPATDIYVDTACCYVTVGGGGVLKLSKVKKY